jgi:hypothetical protein
MEVNMNELINTAVKATAVAQLVAGIKCAWPHIASTGSVPDDCKKILRFFFDYKYLYHHGLNQLFKLVEIDPEGPIWPPDWPRPDPPPIDARLQMHEDVLFTLASLITEPGDGQAGIGALLRDPQLSLESAKRVHQALENSRSMLAEEIARLEQL